MVFSNNSPTALPKNQYLRWEGETTKKSSVPILVWWHFIQFKIKTTLEATGVYANALEMGSCQS